MQSKYLHCNITNCSTVNIRQGKRTLTHQETIIPNKARDLSKQQALNNIECILGF